MKDTVAVITFILLLCIKLDAQRVPPEVQPIFDIESVISIEKQYGIEGSARKAQRRFDKIYNDVENSFVRKDSYTQSDAISYFELVAEVLKEHNVIPSSNTFILLRLGDKKSYLDCDNLSLIYISIAHRLNLPVYPVYAPGHVFIRWYFNDSIYYNWDPRGRRHEEDDYYIWDFKIANNAIEKGVYLSKVSLDKALAPLYSDLANAYKLAGNYEAALELADSVIALDSMFFTGHLVKAEILSEIGRNSEVIEIYDHLKTLDSLDSRIYLRQIRMLLSDFMPAQAEVKALEYIDFYERHGLHKSYDYYRTKTLLFESYFRQRKREKAEEIYTELLDLRRKEGFGLEYIYDCKQLFKKYGITPYDQK